MALAIAALRAADRGSDALRSTPNACEAVSVLKAGVAARYLGEEIEPGRLRGDLGRTCQRDHFEDNRVNYPRAPHGNGDCVEPVLGQEAVYGAGTRDDMTGVKAGVSGLELGGVGDRLTAFDPPLLAPWADKVDRLDPIDQEVRVELGAMGGSRQAAGQGGAGVASRSIQLKPRMLRVQEGRKLIHGYTCFNMKVVLLRGTGAGRRGCQSRPR